MVANRTFPMIVAALAACGGQSQPPALHAPHGRGPWIFNVHTGSAPVELMYVPFIHDRPFVSGPPSETGDPSVAPEVRDVQQWWHDKGFRIIAELRVLILTLLDNDSILALEGELRGTEFRTRFHEFLTFVEQRDALADDDVITTGRYDEDAILDALPMAPSSDEHLQSLLADSAGLPLQLLHAGLRLANAMLQRPTLIMLLTIAQRSDAPIVGVEDEQAYCAMGAHWRAMRADRASATEDHVERDAHTILDRYGAFARACATTPLPSCVLLERPYAAAGIQALRTIATLDSSCPERAERLTDSAAKATDVARAEHAVANAITEAHAHGKQRAVLLFGAGHAAAIVRFALRRDITLRIACTPLTCTRAMESLTAAAVR